VYCKGLVGRARDVTSRPGRLRVALLPRPFGDAIGLFVRVSGLFYAERFPKEVAFFLPLLDVVVPAGVFAVRHFAFIPKSYFNSPPTPHQTFLSFSPCRRRPRFGSDGGFRKPQPCSGGCAVQILKGATTPGDWRNWRLKEVSAT